MTESASGQDEANPAFWLATRAEKMGPACLSRFGFFALVPKEKVIFLAIQYWKCQNGWMLALFFFVFLLTSTTRVPKRFLRIRDYKGRSGKNRNWKYAREVDAKNNSRDYGIARNVGSGLRDWGTLLGTFDHVFVHKNVQKTSTNIQPPWPHAWSIARLRCHTHDVTS